MLKLFKDKPFTKEISDEIVAKRKAMVKKLREISKDKGKLLFEGKWLTPNEIKEYNHLMKKQNRQIFLELIGLFMIMLGLTAFFGLILLSFCS